VAAPPVAAAADLEFALAEAAERFAAQTGQAVRLSFGSSGNFTAQIENGAPFQLFLSADEALVFRLAERGFARDRGALYAVGRIVLFLPAGSPLRLDASLADLRAAAADGRLRRFAIAKPEHAPYGRAAREALERAGAWALVQPRLVLGENAAQAAHFAASGSAQGGIVPLSLAKSEAFGRRGTWVPLPEASHSPLRQRMALMRHAGSVAEAFYRYLQSPPARLVLERWGFVLPAAPG
jgi:molybdate transport system substrate-binding protein